jgi:hypothetical protein
MRGVGFILDDFRMAGDALFYCISRYLSVFLI